MSEDGSRITKTVWQCTEVLPEETLAFLRSIAADYSKVKENVYERYSGVGNLGGLGSVFEIQTRMRHCGLREQLNLPAVYYELAVREAVSDIKGMWGMVKNRIRALIDANENLDADERMYLRTVLKLDPIYAALLERKPYPLPKKAEGMELDRKRLDNLLRRLTRRCLGRPSAGGGDSFSVSPGGYSYRDGQLWLASRERHRRVALPLKDQKVSDRQIRICIRKDHADIAIPRDREVKRYSDFRNTLYVHLGSRCMCTLSTGSIYGDCLGAISSARTERLTEKNRGRGRMRTEYRTSLAEGNGGRAAAIEANNLGRDKYDRQMRRDRTRIESYINAEINRMITAEKPAKIVITRPVAAGRSKYGNKAVNRMLTGSFRGYVRKRLTEKCAAHGIELVEINSRGTGSICSRCGAPGERSSGVFLCSSCGFESTASLNGARNIERKYNQG